MDVTGLSTVSVVIPAYNEEVYIRACVESFLEQDYPPENLEIIVVDGGSADATPAIVTELARMWPARAVRLVENPRRITSAGLNAGITGASGDVIVIFGAHAVANSDYVRLSVETLSGNVAGASQVQGDARFPRGIGVAGGRLVEQGQTLVGRAIGAARSSPIGGAVSRHRYSSSPGLADTVPYGAYKREVFESVGLFDLHLIRNQDDEFNYRVRKAGFAIYYNPDIQGIYRPRTSFGKLAKQMFGYGFWKPLVLTMHPHAISPSFLVPPVFVATLLALIILAPVSLYFRSLLGVTSIAYVLFTGAFAVRAGSRHGWSLVPLIWFSFWVIHACVGAGMLCGLVRLLPWTRRKQ